MFQFVILKLYVFPVLRIFANWLTFPSFLPEFKSVYLLVTFTGLQNRIPVEIMSCACSSCYIGINLLSELAFRKLPLAVLTTNAQSNICLKNLQISAIVLNILLYEYEVGHKMTFKTVRNFSNNHGKEIYEDVRFGKHVPPFSFQKHNCCEWSCFENYGM